MPSHYSQSKSNLRSVSVEDMRLSTQLLSDELATVDVRRYETPVAEHDPATLPDVPANATRRRTLVDRLLRVGLEALVARGFTTGFAKVPKGSKMATYVESITGVAKIDDPETSLRNRYSMDLAQAITFLQTRSG